MTMKLISAQNLLQFLSSTQWLLKKRAKVAKITWNPGLFVTFIIHLVLCLFASLMVSDVVWIFVHIGFGVHTWSSRDFRTFQSKQIAESWVLILNNSWKLRSLCLLLGKNFQIIAPDFPAFLQCHLLLANRRSIKYNKCDKISQTWQQISV